MRNPPLVCDPPLSASHIAAGRLAASNMTGPRRRAWQAEMTLPYGQGTPLQAATVLGWGRHPVALGLAERRTGSMGLGAQAAFSGRQRWEAQQPEIAAVLRQLAAAHAQPAPTVRTTLASTRLTRPRQRWQPGRPQARARSHGPRRVPWRRDASGWACGGAKGAQPNRKKSLRRLRQFVPRWKKDQEAPASPSLKRLRIAWQATVASGDVSRGGLRRGAPRACDHDVGGHEQYMPCGIVDADHAWLRRTCGRSCKPSAGSVEARATWWAALEETEQVRRARLQSNMENGPASRGTPQRGGGVTAPRHPAVSRDAVAVCACTGQSCAARALGACLRFPWVRQWAGRLPRVRLVDAASQPIATPRHGPLLEVSRGSNGGGVQLHLPHAHHQPPGEGPPLALREARAGPSRAQGTLLAQAHSAGPPGAALQSVVAPCTRRDRLAAIAWTRDASGPAHVSQVISSLLVLLQGRWQVLQRVAPRGGEQPH